MHSVVFFPGTGERDISRVGGKAASLIRLGDEGFDVPPGAVLTLAFFEPWFAAIRATAEWQALAAGSDAEWAERCLAVKAQVARLEVTVAQQRALDELGRLDGDSFAVRSSSPDEDLGTASFAGGYETRLGVPRAGLETAIRACFASSLDARVMYYKREHGFDPFCPRIAVIIQLQVDSDIAGVGFSVNPLTNDYDEAVFDASWGLGESVVSGSVTPDHFVVNKVDGTILQRTLGSKSGSLRLSLSGPQVREEPRRDEFCLGETQLAELAAQIVAIEAAYGKPMDIEFAYAGDDLYVLQARPITAWVPLPESMKTAPGGHRRLYMDAALSGGLATNAPLSPVGESFFERFATLMIGNYVGDLPWKLGPGDEVAFLRGGRLYADLSNVLWLVGPKLIASSQARFDELMAATLRSVDRKTYRASRRPVWVSPWAIVLYLRAVWHARRMVWNMLRAVFTPRSASVRYAAAVEQFAAEWREVPSEGTVSELLEERGMDVIRHVLDTLMAGLLVAMIGMSVADKIVPKRHRKLAERLTRGFQGNVVVDMGGALHRMSKLLTPADLADPEKLAERLAADDVPEVFAESWRDFVAEYGWRGPYEVDMGQPRYQDEPLLALRQMCAMAQSDFDPTDAHRRHVAERGEAYDALMKQLGFVRRFVLRPAYRWIDLFAGTRDTPKHQYLMLFAAARARVMRQGAELAAAGRLDAAEHAIDLRLEDLEIAATDETQDLRAMRAERTKFVDLLHDVVKSFPPIIDSRGRIIRAARGAEGPGEAIGMPVSPGVVRGPAKVLLNPQHKPVNPGDILIAYTTDPGWTPLFVNAAAVVLEVGGVLQHGAVVAREYGKPCVVGISGLLDRFEDGERLEVDGSAGVVRRVTPDDGEQGARSS